MTSRPITSIEKEAFRKMCKFWLKAVAERESEAVEKRNGRVIRARIKVVTGNKDFSTELPEKFQTQTMGNADHAFLWVSPIV